MTASHMATSARSRWPAAQTGVWLSSPTKSRDILDQSTGTIPLSEIGSITS